MTEMPSYTCSIHKKVRAMEIGSVGNYITNAGGNLVRAVGLGQFGEILQIVDLPDEMFRRYVPEPGDFLVVYEDGHQSFLPRKAFLDGYRRDAVPGEGLKTTIHPSTLRSDLGDTLMDQLNDLAAAGPGVAPLWLQSDDWATQIARVAREAYVTINSLKFQLEQKSKNEA